MWTWRISHRRRRGPEDRRAAGENPLRDPRRENSVGNMELLPSEARATSQDLAEEDVTENTPSRVEDVELQQLYLCELVTPEHGLRLGLCMAEK